MPTLPSNSECEPLPGQLISAIVCTRNRGTEIKETIETILQNEYPSFEVVIIDQSTDDITASTVAPFTSDPRVRYIRTDTKGLSRARNIGLNAASGELAIFTDDDCTVPSDWLEKMHGVFASNPEVVVAFCNVEAAPCDNSAGFIPGYFRSSSSLLDTIADKPRSRGIGAGMAVRREQALAMGGFDEQLGSGAEFPAAEDDDMALRALLMGHKVYETSAVSVTHFGFRTFEQGKQLGRSSWRGLGAAYSKPLRAGYKSSWIIPAHEFFVVILGSLVRDVLHLKRPQGFSRIPAFIGGFMEGWKTPVDNKTLRFRHSY